MRRRCLWRIVEEAKTLYHAGVSKPYFSNFLQRKQTCFFPNLRMAGYLKVHRDIWPNLGIGASRFYDIFILFFCNYLYISSKYKSYFINLSTLIINYARYLAARLLGYWYLFFKYIYMIMYLYIILDCSLYEYLDHIKFHNFN